MSLCSNPCTHAVGRRAGFKTARYRATYCLLHGNFIRVAARRNKQNVFEPHSSPYAFVQPPKTSRPCATASSLREAQRRSNLLFAAASIAPCVIAVLDTAIFRQDYPVKPGNDMLPPSRPCTRPKRAAIVHQLQDLPQGKSWPFCSIKLIP